MNGPLRCLSLAWAECPSPLVCHGCFLIIISFSSPNEVVTALSTIDDLMDVLVQRRVIPADYRSIYTLGYGRSGPLWGSSMIASVGAGSLLHFHLRVCVCGGTGELFPISRTDFINLLCQHTPQHREHHPYHQGVLLCRPLQNTPAQNVRCQMRTFGNALTRRS